MLTDYHTHLRPDDLGASAKEYFTEANVTRYVETAEERGITELGFSLVLFPIGALLAATAGIRALLATLRADGTPQAAMAGLPTFDGFTDLIGLPEIRTLEGRFGTTDGRGAP